MPASAPSPSSAPAGGTRHVRDLARFLETKLGEKGRRELVEQLGREGYQGDKDFRILEYCVRVADPIVIANELRRSEIRSFLEELGQEIPTGADGQHLARLLLESFGFPEERTPRGLSSTIREIKRLEKRVMLGNLIELKGTVTSGGAQIEFVAITLLRFVCQAMFRKPPETYFRERKLLQESQKRIDRLSLGTLLQLLDHLAKDQNVSRWAALFRREFDIQSLSPKGSGNLTELQNHFAHFEKGEFDRHSLDDARKKAIQFFASAVQYLTHLADERCRVFPHVVLIERIVIDRWGRRTVEALNENGETETIFTDRELRPGELYYMHPVTNPLGRGYSPMT